MTTMNSYRKGWALRYLREAKAELTAAQRVPYIAPSLILEALRKAQIAIYYSLGEPTSIALIVQKSSYTKECFEDSILKFLVEIERTVQQVAQRPRSNSRKMMEQVNNLLQLASEIVELFTSEKLS